ncbi:MAG: 2-C-methyl-D-erythritol 4-phosphate cytidylyltransferase [Bacteroidaceae bacterium]|nr:2-C-methyl-D-erythritol 4-phosphate cytidylyltransferase [Bacteroidaceae bacterium]
MTKAVIIVAGGKGLRMGGDIPKQFLVVKGKPILMHTIERFHDFDPSMQIVVVLPKDQHDYWNELCQQYRFNIPITIANGGIERFHSVKNGIAAVTPEAQLIGVHDGVRPYVAIDVIRRCYEAAAADGAAIPVVDVVETLRHITPDGSHTVPRSEYKLVQTPQVFQADILRRAYEQPFNPGFTDDASVVEAIDQRITLVEGNRENIKITTKADL